MLLLYEVLLPSGCCWVFCFVLFKPTLCMLLFFPLIFLPLFDSQDKIERLQEKNGKKKKINIKKSNITEKYSATKSDGFEASFEFV